jgi:hypothetical protein
LSKIDQGRGYPIQRRKPPSNKNAIVSSSEVKVYSRK